MKAINIQLDDDVYEQLTKLLESQSLTAQAFYEGYTLSFLAMHRNSSDSASKDADSLAFDQVDSLLGDVSTDSGYWDDMKETMKGFLGW